MVNGATVSLDAESVAPDWDDAPFRSVVPEYMSVQLSFISRNGVKFTLYSKVHDLWVECPLLLGAGREFSNARDVLPMVQMLAMACFEQEFPEELAGMHYRRAELGKRSLPPPIEDEKAWSRLKELGAEISAS